MEGIVESLPKVIQYIFSSLLLIVLLGWGSYNLSQPIRRPFTRALGRFRLLSIPAKVFLACFVSSWIVYAVTKDGGSTNATQSMMSAPRRILHLVQEAISSNDVARGYRVAETDGGSIVPMPAGAVTNEYLRRRGGFDWAFRVAPDGWRFPYRDGFLDGVTVIARGEVRPDVGTLYFPMPITNGVSLLPEARWNLLPAGGASVFSHAETEEGSLLLDWRNALVGRDPNCPTNLQMELFADGSFAWRTDGESQFYIPVFPFDWDGDGLENSVDPEPLVPNPVDAHGTTPEWYGIVCSNVFVSTGTTGVPPVDEGLVQFKEGVNSNAYYFAEVVAERGPAPIYFNADRDSNLGSPVVVAHGGVTNRVPLLIGIEYAVTSTVPISVSVPDSMYATVTTNDDRSVTVKWPVDFEFNEHVGESSRTYTIDVVPFDPGGTFSWENASQHEGPSLMSASPSDGCHCVSYLGRAVVFACTSTCECGGICKASGSYAYEGTLIPVSGGECRCGFDDPPEDPHPLPGNDPVFFLSFSHDAVVYENAYQDSPGVWKSRRSTRVRLTVVALPGSNGGTLSLSSTNLGKLRPIACGPVSLPSSLSLEPEDIFERSYLFEAEEESDSANDVVVSGSYHENGTDYSFTNQTQLTVMRIELRATVDPPDENFASIHRHTFGVCERVECLQSPSSPVASLSSSDGGTYFRQGNALYFDCPLHGCENPLSVECNGTVYRPLLSVIEPQSVLAILRHGTTRGSVVTYSALKGEAGGIGMLLNLYVRPLSVSFSKIRIQEVPQLTYQASGYFTNPYFNGNLSHTTLAGAGTWLPVSEKNLFGYDTAAYKDTIPWLAPTGNPTNNIVNAWTEGYVYIDNPFGWNTENCDNDDPPYKMFATDVQDEIMIDSNGTVGVRKLFNQVIRTTNNVIRLNGVLIQ